MGNSFLNHQHSLSNTKWPSKSENSKAWAKWLTNYCKQAAIWWQSNHLSGNLKTKKTLNDRL
jgi:hypothetical protein